jgi:3-dehydro-L-gulonate-6-phosphate decarboxylase
MAELPIIQLALDYVELPPALAMAQIIRDEVEAIEIGTPLTKAEGMNAVTAVRELCPDNIILADVKTPDVGGLEAKICFDAGADWMTVLGAAPLVTVQLALEEANSRPGKEAIIELTGIRDILARAREWRSIGMERMVYHRGWDEGNTSRLWEPRDRAIIEELIRMGFKISVAGALELETISFFQGVDISVFVIGRAIRETPDPAATARLFRAEINRIYGGGVTGYSVSDQAAKAVRWGISEMGLYLTVDGRDCPGCDAPGRFCHGTLTEIIAPAGVDSQVLVNQIATNLETADRSAVGWSQPGTFYLDIGALSRLNTPAVVGLLATTGQALNRLGHGVETRNALNVAQSIMNEYR